MSLLGNFRESIKLEHISNDDFLPVIRSDLLSRLQVMQGYDTSYLAKSWMCCIPKKKAWTLTRKN